MLIVIDKLTPRKLLRVSHHWSIGHRPTQNLATPRSIKLGIVAEMTWMTRASRWCSGMSKFLQRRLLSFINSNLGSCILLFFLYAIAVEIVDLLRSTTSPTPLRSSPCAHCSRMDYFDNIGDFDMQGLASYGPIDVVYTWVNGSDPVWLAKKESHQLEMGLLFPSSQMGSNATGSSSGNSSSGGPVFDEYASSNRYRDNEELRYSLRSLALNAPWVRRIFIVTDNQVPSWLDVRHPRVTLISHADIFPNASHLPVFSSPAIETHLHRIPGLARLFIYFNDDVMLGAPSLPEDFLSVSGVHKFHLSWEVPKCSPGCSDSWIGDGYCDKACNVSSCNFDYPDCINGSDSSSRHNVVTTGKVGTFCSVGCPDGWLGDKVCDMRCKNEECGWDMGDCGISLVTGGFPGVRLRAARSEGAYQGAETASGLRRRGADEHNTPARAETVSGLVYSGAGTGYARLSAHRNETVIVDGSAVINRVELFPSHGSSGSSGSSGGGSNDPGKKVGRGMRDMAVIRQDEEVKREREFSQARDVRGLGWEVALRVPLGTRAVYFNVSVLACVSDPALLGPCRGAADVPGFVLESAELGWPAGVAADDAASSPSSSFPSSDSAQTLVHHALLIQKHQVLVATLYSSQEDRPPPPPLPARVLFTVHGSNSRTNVSVSARFVLEVTADLKAAAHARGYPDMRPESGGRVSTSSSGNASYVQGYSAGCLGSSGSAGNRLEVPVVHSSVVERPFRLDGQDMQGVALVGALLGPTTLTHLAHLQGVPSRRVRVHYTLTASPRSPNPNPNPTQPYTLTARTANSSQAAAAAATANASRRLGLGSDQNTSRPEISFSGSLPLCMAAGEADPQTLLLRPAYTAHGPSSAASRSESESVACPATLLALLHDQVRRPTHAQQLLQFKPFPPQYSREGQSVDGPAIEDVGYWTLLVPVPFAWAERQWVHALVRVVLEEEGTGAVGGEGIGGTGAVGGEGIGGTGAVGGEGIGGTGAVGGEELGWRPAGAKGLDGGKAASEALLACFIASFKWGSALQAPIKANATSLNYDSEALSQSPRRRLTVTLATPATTPSNPDTYAASLIHVNRLYTKAFGAELRKVPAHMPHMIDAALMRDLQARWPDEWNATSSHRFRSGRDMQYSFAYYYYVMSRERNTPLDQLHFLRTAVDSDGDGFLDEREMHTLAAIVHNKSPKLEDIAALRECAFNSSSSSSSSNYDSTRSSGLLAASGVSSHALPLGSGRVHKKFSLEVVIYPSIAQVLACSLVSAGLRQNVQWTQRRPSHILGTDKDVSFEMIGDNITESTNRLNSIRARQSKFICVNDNIRSTNETVVAALQAALKEFFLAFYPLPSTFELPVHKSNPSLYLDECRAAMAGEVNASSTSHVLDQMAKLPLVRGISSLVACAADAVRGALSLLDDESSQSPQRGGGLRPSCQPR